MDDNGKKFEMVGEDDPVFDMGISSLHLGPRMFEMVIKMSARRRPRVYHKNKSTENEIEAEKERICREKSFSLLRIIFFHWEGKKGKKESRLSL